MVTTTVLRHPRSESARLPAIHDQSAADPEPADIQSLLAARAQAATRCFDAEVALHHAHQSHIDIWINAAADKLHTAVLELADADAALGHPWH